MEGITEAHDRQAARGQLNRLAPGIGVVQQLTRLDRDTFAGPGPTTRSAVVSGPLRSLW
jgi:hypothetical protein